MKKIRNSRKGFTLTEIVLVVAIIVILSSVSLVGIAVTISNAQNNQAKLAAHNDTFENVAWMEVKKLTLWDNNSGTAPNYSPKIKEATDKQCKQQLEELLKIYNEDDILVEYDESGKYITSVKVKDNAVPKNQTDSSTGNGSSNADGNQQSQSQQNQTQDQHGQNQQNQTQDQQGQNQQNQTQDQQGQNQQNQTQDQQNQGTTDSNSQTNNNSSSGNTTSGSSGSSSTTVNRANKTNSWDGNVQYNLTFTYNGTETVDSITFDVPLTGNVTQIGGNVEAVVDGNVAHITFKNYNNPIEPGTTFTDIYTHVQGSGNFGLDI